MLPAELTQLMTDALSPHAAGQTYLSSVPRTARRDEGQVYTPESIVRFILDLSDYTAEQPIETLTMLDPACGAGAFLVAAVERLGERLNEQGHDPRAADGRQMLLEVVERRVLGVDKDPHACELARLAVGFKLGEISGQEPPEGFFRANVVEDDFLLGRLEAVSPESFDLIVGNPPYVATTRLSDEQKDDLRSRFIVANGRLDLYTMFFERALRLLKLHGRLTFITPNKFLISESSRRLRKLILSSARVCAIANFRSHRVFEDAAAVPCVTVLERAPATADLRLLECTVAPGGRGPVTVHTRTTVSHPKGGDQPWFLADPQLLALAHAIQDQHPTLGQLSSRISAGIATGRDRIYVLCNGAGEELEQELRRPAVRGQDLLRFHINDPQLEIILPYLPTSDGRPTLVDLDDFPKTKAYLEAHRRELESRHCVRTWQKAWYDIHDPWTLDITRITKVLVPDVACSSRFVLDSGAFCPLHSAYYVIPRCVDPMYLTAVLNASPLEFLIRLLAPVVKDGFSRYRRQFLVTLPIPEASGPTRSDIVAAAQSGDLSKADELCCQLFRLSRKDVRTMRDFLKRARSVHGASPTPSTTRTSP
jgi:adenine-specific DNA-methyltransferase